MTAFTQDKETFLETVKILEEDLENIKRIAKYAEKEEIKLKFEIHPKAETVKQSAQHTDIEKNQILKTIVFKTEKNFIAVLARGNVRIDEKKVEKETSEKLKRLANPDEVKNKTGYIVGGVSPFDLDIPVYIDKELLNYEKVRPAAGSKLVGCIIKPETLKETTNSTAINIK